MVDERRSAVQMSSSSKVCVRADRSKLDLKYFMAEVLGLFLWHSLIVLLFPLVTVDCYWFHLSNDFEFLPRSLGFLGLFFLFCTSVFDWILWLSDAFIWLVIMTFCDYSCWISSLFLDVLRGCYMEDFQGIQCRFVKQWKQFVFCSHIVHEHWQLDQSVRQITTQCWLLCFLHGRSLQLAV